jgi:ABC-type phosphate transport system substrate-binding protein
MTMKKMSFVGFLLVAMAGAHAGELVLIANPAVGALTKEQVADVFLGKSQTLTPIDQPEGSPIYADFYKKATGRDVAQVKSTWSRVVFTGKGQPPKQMPDSVAVRKAVAADPKGVGYVDKMSVDGSVKTLYAIE